MTLFDRDFLIGKSQENLVLHNQISALIHRLVIPPFLALQEEARLHGLDLQIASGYRDYERQLKIWNEKTLGLRPVMDHEGKHPLDISKLSAKEKIFSILRWSALPGASRHHWGTDMDIFDRKALTPEYRLQLIPEETHPKGIFGPLHLWLDERLANNTSFGFYRPYEIDLGGVSPEKWHISYAPLSREFAQQYSLSFFYQHLSMSPEIELKENLLEFHEEIYERFICKTSPPPFLS